jgi:hypothetical protein
MPSIRLFSSHLPPSCTTSKTDERVHDTKIGHTTSEGKPRERQNESQSNFSYLSTDQLYVVFIRNILFKIKYSYHMGRAYAGSAYPGQRCTAFGQGPGLTRCASWAKPCFRGRKRRYRLTTAAGSIKPDRVLYSGNFIPFLAAFRGYAHESAPGSGAEQPTEHGKIKCIYYLRDSIRSRWLCMSAYHIYMVP